MSVCNAPIHNQIESKYQNKCKTKNVKFKKCKIQNEKRKM